MNELSHDIVSESFKEMLLNWVHHDAAIHRLDHVLAVLNGGQIFGQHSGTYLRHRKWVMSGHVIYGEPNHSPRWTEMYKRFFVNLERNSVFIRDDLDKGISSYARGMRETISFIIFYDIIVDSVLSFCSFLPSYVILEILDWVPSLSKAFHLFKITLIENIFESVSLDRARSLIKYGRTLKRRLDRKEQERNRLFNALIVLKGSYTGRVSFFGSNHFVDALIPNLQGKTMENVLNVKDSIIWQGWINIFENLAFLEKHFVYLADDEYKSIYDGPLFYS